MEWFTLEWLMRNLEWAVGLLMVGCIILFFFPILLGLQIKQDDDGEKDQSEMDIVTTVMSVWQEFLGVMDFSPEDNYFALGGDSLIASRIAAKLNELYPVDLKISQLLENQTCSSVAAVIESLMIEKINNMSEEEAISLL